jgi:hypothetical protein
MGMGREENGPHGDKRKLQVRELCGHRNLSIPLIVALKNLV